jgi:type IX secretion system PorP/SprF family membrane protein
MRRLLYASIFVAFIAKNGAVLAQQDPTFTLFYFNPGLYQPAYMPADHLLHLDLQGRSQWVGLNGHPQQGNVIMQLPIPAINSGAGFQIINEEAGVLSTTALSVNYSYQINIRESQLSFGVNVGGIQVSLNGSKLIAPEGEYLNGIDHNDPILPTTNVSSFGPDAGLGISFRNKHIYSALSAQHLIPVNLKWKGYSDESNYSLSRQYNLLFGYHMQFHDVAFDPVVFLQANNAYFQGMLNGMVTYRNFLWLGVGVRGYSNQTLDAVAAMAGIRINNQWRVAYSYDYNLSALSSVNHGSHEIVINYQLQIIKPSKAGKAVYNPRF